MLDRERAARLGVPQATVADAIAMAVAGSDATVVQDGRSKYPRPVRLRLPAQDQASLQALLAAPTIENEVWTRPDFGLTCNGKASV